MHVLADVPPRARRRARIPVAAAVAVALLAASTACSGMAPLPKGRCSLPGYERWVELRSAHFDIVLPDEGRDHARVVATFEELHAAIVASLIAEPVEIPGRVRVVVIPDATFIGLVGSPNVEGLFWVSALGEPTILLKTDALEDVPEVAAHELAHHVSFHLFPRQPRWFAEGLAQFVESLAKPDRQGRRWAGGDPLTGWAVDGIYLTKMEYLLTTGSGGYLDNAHLTSWLLYRFLWNRHGARFSEFQRRLVDGWGPISAWNEVFPEWNLDGGKLHLLDHQLGNYRISGEGTKWQVTVPEVDRRYTASSASTADLHMVLLGAKLLSSNRILAPGLRRAAAREALEEEPTNPVAIAELAFVEGTPALPGLRASVAARPQDGRGWFLLAGATDAPGEREEALRRAVALWPDGALAHAALAAELAGTGRAREAVREVNRGLELAPWNPAVIAVLARVALDLDKCPEAALLAARAVDVAAACGVGSGGADAEAIRRQLEETRSRCRADAPGASAR